MADLSELKEKLIKVEKALNNKGLPEAGRPALVKKQAELKRDIAEIEGESKKKIVKPKPEKKPKVEGKKRIPVVRQKKEKTLSDVEKAISPLKELLGHGFKFEKINDGDAEVTSPQGHTYRILETTPTLISIIDTSEIPNIGFKVIKGYGSISELAEMIAEAIKNRIGSEKKEPEKEKPEPKSDKDDISECKKILELANYDVKSKTVKTKNGKKTVKTKEPRPDRQIITDRTKSIFTTITKAYNSEEEKDANKELLDTVEAVKDLMVKFMNSLDKLVGSKDVDKIKKIQALLKKLVD